MEELVGKTLGQYQVQGKIGEGGMAAVYRAYQPSLDRYVAIKVLPPNRDPDFAARFQREARSIANLSHPNILAVHDFDTDQGYSYIVMHFVQGGKTMRHLAREEPGQKLLIEILVKVAKALDYAHRRNIIHRDVKPGNVLLEDERPLLADFGLAKLSHESGTRITRSGAGGIGTPAYMSPEQGYGHQVDHRTDIYALGVMLYEIITGEIPHHANTPFGIIAKRNNEPVPPPRKINPNISPNLEQVVLRALRIGPEERYASAADFADSLKIAVTGGALREKSGTEELTVLSPEPRSEPTESKQPEAVTEQPDTDNEETVASDPPVPKPIWRKPWAMFAGFALIGTLIWGGFVFSPGPSEAEDKPATPLEIDTTAPDLTETSTSTPTPVPITTFTPQATDTPDTVADKPVDVPVVNTFSVDKTDIIVGENVLLEWDVEGVQSVSVAPLGAGFPPVHSLELSPEEDTTYILTASNGSTQIEPISLEILVSPLPTDTPIPPTDTVTPTQTPTLAHTATPGPPTATATNSPSPTPNLPQGTFTLLNPISVDPPSFGPTTFEWQWVGTLPPDTGFEISVWLEGDPRAGVHDAVNDNKNGQVQQIGENRYRLNVDISEAPGVRNRRGDYLWTVALVKIDPSYMPLGQQAEPSVLRFEPPGTGSSGSSSSSGGSSAPSGGID